MKSLKVFIPTRGRSDFSKQKTLRRFLEETKVEPTLVVSRKSDLPKEYNKKFIIVPRAKISDKRQYLYSKNLTPFMTLDDDLSFSAVTWKGGNVVSTSTDFNFEDFYQECWELSQQYGISGIHPHFMIKNAKDRWMEFKKIYRVMIINRGKLMESNSLVFRLNTGEDHDFHLQAISGGNRTAISANFTQRDVENAPGGCSDWREDVLQDVSKLQSLWPKFVTIKSNGRPIIQFGKAGKHYVKA